MFQRTLIPIRQHRNEIQRQGSFFLRLRTWFCVSEMFSLTDEDSCGIVYLENVEPMGVRFVSLLMRSSPDVSSAFLFFAINKLKLTTIGK